MQNRKIHQAKIYIAVAGLLLFACNSPISLQSATRPAPTAGSTPSQTAGSTPSQTAAAAIAQTAAPTPTPRNSPHLVGYFHGVNKNNHVAAIPGNLLTDIIYAFINISPEGRCVSFDPAHDQANFAALKQLKEKYPGIHILFAIGGAGSSSRFSDTAASAASRQAFVQSCMQILQQNGFDGIDIDWEFPGRSNRLQDRENFTALLSEFRKQLDAQGKTDGRAYLLTIAAPAGENETAGFDLEKIQPLVDWVNLMTYDYYDERSETTNFNAALYPVEADPGNRSYSADTVVRAYLAAGIPGNKIMVGALFSGNAWKGVPAAQDGLFQPAQGPFDDPDVPQGTWNEEGTISYKSLQKYYLNAPGWESYWQAEAQAPWLYNVEKGAFITYDDARSLTAKADYVIANNLGGVMIWQIGADDPDNTLLKALAARLLP